MRGRVAVAHNDPALLEQMASALRDAGFYVSASTNAIRVAEYLDPNPPDALVTRINFGPRTLNGVALARMARIRRRSIGIVFVTERDWGSLLTDLGDVLRLPVDTALLVQTVQRQLRASRRPDTA